MTEEGHVLFIAFSSWGDKMLNWIEASQIEQGDFNSLLLFIFPPTTRCSPEILVFFGQNLKCYLWSAEMH